MILTALTFSTFLTPPKNLSLAKEPQTKREPSSVFSIHNFSKLKTDTQKAEEPEFYSVDLDCKSIQNLDNFNIDSKGKNIRFQSTCAEKLSWLSITNTSNNHSGQVLKLNSQGIMTSDFIRLNKGKNVVQLLLQDQNGDVVKKSFSVVY